MDVGHKARRLNQLDHRVGVKRLLQQVDDVIVLGIDGHVILVDDRDTDYGEIAGPKQNFWQVPIAAFRLARKVAQDDGLVTLLDPDPLVACSLDQFAVDTRKTDRVDPVLLAQFHEPFVLNAGVAHQDGVDGRLVRQDARIARDGGDDPCRTPHFFGDLVAYGVSPMDDDEAFIQLGQVLNDSLDVDLSAASYLNDHHRKALTVRFSILCHLSSPEKTSEEIRSE